MKKWLCMVLCIGMMFGATGCGDTGTGTVENKEVTLSLPYGERTGTYSGDMVEGVTDGHGKFETKNEAGETWTYEGDFSAGVFEGEGKTTWEDGTVQIGTYHEGVWQATEWGLLFAAESTDAITVSDEASSFIKENADFFPSDSVEKFQDNVDESITYKMVMKEPDKYGNKIMKANDLYVVQINTSQIYKDCEDKYTYAIQSFFDMGMAASTPKVCPRMERPPKETRNATSVSRRRRPSGERLRRCAPFVISRIPLQRPCSVSVESGRKNSRRESRENSPACSIAAESTANKIR